MDETTLRKYIGQNVGVRVARGSRGYDYIGTLVAVTHGCADFGRRVYNTGSIVALEPVDQSAVDEFSSRASPSSRRRRRRRRRPPPRRY